MFYIFDKKKRIFSSYNILKTNQIVTIYYPETTTEKTCSSPPSSISIGEKKKQINDGLNK